MLYFLLPVCVFWRGGAKEIATPSPAPLNPPPEMIWKVGFLLSGVFNLLRVAG